MSRLALILLVDCAGTPVAYDVEPVRAPYGTPIANAVAERAGTCDARVRVRVIDEHHAPVKHARVVVSRRVRAMAVEEDMGVAEYRTHPVLTDANGFAHVCDPDRLPPVPWFEGFGGGYSIRGRAQLDVFAPSGRTATTYEPFAAQLIVR